MPSSTRKETPPASSSTAESLESLYEKGRQCVLERDFVQAATFFSRCLRMAPDNLSVLVPLALVLYKTGRIQQAMTMYRKALPLSPDDPGILTGIANCHMAEGDFAKATAYFERALKAKPDEVGVIYNLTVLHQYPLDAPLVRELERLYDSRRCIGQSRSLVCFSLARIYESHGGTHRAFRYYAEANEALFPLVKYNERCDTAFLEEIKATFTSQLFRSLGGLGCKDAIPIFVLGMPRSGTSLVEHILASHSGVYGAGEMSILSWMTSRLLPQTFGTPFPRLVTGLNRLVFADIGKLYLELLSSQCPANAGRIVSKTLENYALIGLIHLLFPNAPIVHCVRDPMDTCWSLYRQYFGIETVPGYCYEQGTLGRYYRRYQTLMNHWHQVLPGRIHDVRYEELVEHPEATMRALLEYCDLSWEDRCLTFFRTKRVVNTANAVQVRRPLYKTSIQSWLPVADELAPLRAALEGRR